MVESIRKIITRLGKKLTFKWVRFATNRIFEERFKTFFRYHPEYRHSVDSKIEKNHVELWRAFHKDINLSTLRICSNISGRANPQIVPEDLFASDIQRSLCWQQEKIQYLANKSFYNRWYPGDIFPKVFIHNIQGNFFDDRYNPLKEDEISNLLEGFEYPVVIKPNMDSMGGADIYFPKNKEELGTLMKERRDYVIQEIIQQDEFFSAFNKNGLNTIRVDLYRSVVTNDIHYLHAALRMGQGGGLDNITAGGIHCFINEDGHLNDYAVDVIGTVYKRHPDTKLEFSKKYRIPKFEEMKRLALNVARDMYLSRLISLDLCLDEKGRWRVIEINLNDIAIEFAQFGGKPFFAPFTEEIIDYCIRNPWWKL